MMRDTLLLKECEDILLAVYKSVLQGLKILAPFSFVGGHILFQQIVQLFFEASNIYLLSRFGIALMYGLSEQFLYVRGPMLLFVEVAQILKVSQ